jgi:ABC-type sugar transport system permease subunit
MPTPMTAAAILRGIDIVTMFTSVFIITQGRPGGATETISDFVYRIGFRTFHQVSQSETHRGAASGLDPGITARRRSARSRR